MALLKTNILDSLRNLGPATPTILGARLGVEVCFIQQELNKAEAADEVVGVAYEPNGAPTYQTKVVVAQEDDGDPNA